MKDNFMKIELLKAMRSKKCWIVFITILIPSLYYMRAVFVLGATTLLALILLLIFSIVFALNTTCIIYTIKKSGKFIKKSLLSSIPAILGFSSVQACIAGLCNPGVVLSVFIIFFPSLGSRIEDLAVALLVISIIILLYSLKMLGCFKEEYSFKLNSNLLKKS